MTGSRKLLVVTLMAVAVLALLFGLRGVCARLAVEHWRKQLRSVPDQRAAYVVGQLAELGEAGIPVLVEALGSERESVTRAGKQVLNEKLRHWQTLGGVAGSRNQAILAEELAAHAAEFGPTARSDAADLATQILIWLPNSAEVDRRGVIAFCERVFQAGPDDGDLPPYRTPAPGASSQLDASHSVYNPSLSDASIAELSRLPGGGLPVELTAMPRPQQQSSHQPASGSVPYHAVTPGVADSRGQEPPRSGHSTEGNPFRPGDVPGASPGAATTPPPRTEPQPPRVLSVAPSAPYTASSPEPVAADTPELMRQLRSEHQPTAFRARAELERRGFTTVHFELARRLFDPDPEVRKQLARLLPGVQSVDAAPWLLWLCRDGDAEVRMAAITVAATAGDPVFLEQVEQIARQDSDPRIRSRADRMSAERGRTRY